MKYPKTTGKIKASAREIKQQQNKKNIFFKELTGLLVFHTNIYTDIHREKDQHYE